MESVSSDDGSNVIATLRFQQVPPALTDPGVQKLECGIEREIAPHGWSEPATCAVPVGANLAADRHSTAPERGKEICSQSRTPGFRIPGLRHFDGAHRGARQFTCQWLTRSASRSNHCVSIHHSKNPATALEAAPVDWDAATPFVGWRCFVLQKSRAGIVVETIPDFHFQWRTSTSKFLVIGTVTAFRSTSAPDFHSSGNSADEKNIVWPCGSAL